MSANASSIGPAASAGKLPSATLSTSAEPVASTSAENAIQSIGTNTERWLFNDDQLVNTPSKRDGFEFAKEMKYRRMAARFIQDMGERLNHHLKDARQRISQLCMCAAMIHMHRFFVFHSFKYFDPRDVAAACLFLTGKSEECPRKLEHIVKVWWSLKFPEHPTYAIDVNNKHYVDGAQLLVTLENIILQTIAFDLQVDIPHTYVLNAMHKIVPERGLSNTGGGVTGKKKLTETAYWFASDVLHLTNWGVRYTSTALACVCIDVACIWAGVEIPPCNDGEPWYTSVDPRMTESQLNMMSKEFSRIYRECEQHLQIRRLVAPRNGPGGQGIGSEMDPTGPVNSDGIPVLLPPPVAPSLYHHQPVPSGSARVNPSPTVPKQKVDISQYKQKRAAVTEGGAIAPGASTGATSNASPPRPNFMKPDPSTIMVEEKTTSTLSTELTVTSSGQHRQVKVEVRESSDSSRKRRIEAPAGNLWDNSGGKRRTSTEHHHQQNKYHRKNVDLDAPPVNSSSSFATGPFGSASSSASTSTEHRKRTHERNSPHGQSISSRRDSRDRNRGGVLPEMDLKMVTPPIRTSHSEGVGGAGRLSEKERERHSSSSKERRHHHGYGGPSSSSASGAPRLSSSQPLPERHSSSSKPKPSIPNPALPFPPPPTIPSSSSMLANGVNSGGFVGYPAVPGNPSVLLQPEQRLSPLPSMMLGQFPRPPPGQRMMMNSPSMPLAPPPVPPAMPPLPPELDLSGMMAGHKNPPPPPPPAEDLEEGELL